MTFKEGDIVRFKGGPEVAIMWGDRVTLEFFYVKMVNADGTLYLYSAPYHWYSVDAADYEYVCDQDDFFMDVDPECLDDQKIVKNFDAEVWWHSMDDEWREDQLGPTWGLWVG